MYYLLMTGRIVTERDMRTAYEIAYGSKTNMHYGHYKAWVDSAKGIEKAIPKNEITVEQLIKGECISEAVRLIKEKHHYTIVEASTIVNKIKWKMEKCQ